MKARKYILLTVAFAMLFVSCRRHEGDKDVIGKQDIEVKNGIMTPEALWAFGRVSDVALSPKKDKVVFCVKYYDVKQNKEQK